MSEGSTPTENSDSILTRCTRKLYRHIKDPLYRNSLFLITNTVIITVLGLFFWIIVARLYTKTDVGSANAIISAINLIGMLSLLGLDATLVRFLPTTQKPAVMINSFLTITGIISLAISVIFMLGIPIWSRIHIWSPELSFIHDNPTFAISFVLFTLFLTLSPMIEAIFIAKRKAHFVLIKNSIASLVKIPLPFILFLFFRSFGIVGSVGLSIGIAAAFSIFFLLPRAENGYKAVPTINFEIIKWRWRYSIGSYFISIISTLPILILSSILIVNRKGGGTTANADFSMAWMLSSLLFAIPAAVSQSLFAEGSHFEDKLDANVSRSYKFVFLLLIPAIILFVFTGKWLLLAFGRSYSDNGTTLLQVLSLSAIFVGVNSVYYTILRVKSRIAELIALYGFSTFAILTGSYIIIPTTGIIGVGYVWLSVQGIVSIYVIARLITRYKQHTK